MQLPSLPEAHLTYCLNVHPCSTRDELERALFSYGPDVFGRLETHPFGLGAWISAGVAEALTPAQIQTMAKRLTEQGSYIFTLNGFPYGVFHGQTVKAAVYRPDWSDPARVAYTEKLAHVLAALLPEGVTGSISTVPVTYRAWGQPERVKTAVEHLRQIAAMLAEIEARTGRCIQLALEPEPDCLLDTVETTVDFFTHHLFAGGESWLSRYLGVCLDTVHCGVLFEDPAATLQTLADEGIGVFKVQLGAAIACTDTPETRTALHPFAEPVYLHQTRTRGERMMVYHDLPDALETQPGQEEWRVHYHLPLTWPGRDGLGSTTACVTPAFLQRAHATGCRHFEVEVYTLSVFPDAEGRHAAILADELQHVVNLAVQGRE